MKSILLASKPSNNNQLSVGSQIRHSSISINQHYLNSATTATNGSVAESNEKENYNKLFSNSKKQVIRNRCSAKGDVDKVKRVAGDVCDGISSERLTKVQPNDIADAEYLDNRPLIIDSKISVESETQPSGKSVKLINLRKKNGTTLIFQKKSKNPKANEYQELESFKKRRSLQQWPNTGFNASSDTRNANRHSWYDSDYYPQAIEEEFSEIDVSTHFGIYWGVIVRPT